MYIIKDKFLAGHLKLNSQKLTVYGNFSFIFIYKQEI